MHSSDSEENVLAELHALRSELKEWAFGLRCLFTVLSLLPLYYCTSMLLSAPRFEILFQDMLGSKDKLPGLTRLIFEWSMPLLGGVWLLTVLTIVLIFTLKRARHVWMAAAASGFVLIATGHLISAMLMSPLLSVLQNLSGSGI